MGFIRFRAVCTSLLCALLLALFWFPSRMLKRSADEWNAAISAASEALAAGDDAVSQEAVTALLNSYAQKEHALERFLHHAAVDDVLSALEQAKALTDLGDRAGALSALAAAKGGIAHLLCMERFSWNGLL